MSSNAQSLSGNAIPQLQRVGLNSLITNLTLDADSGNSSLVVRTGSNTSFYIDKYSNVGVNTTSPGAQLEVASANGACMRLRYGASTTAFASIFMTSLGNLSINPNTVGSEVVIPSTLNLSGHNGTSTGLKLNGGLVTTTATQLNYNTVTAGIATNGKALVLNDSGAITGITSIGVSSITINTSTLTGTQAAYLTGVTAGTALSGKALVLDASGNISGINLLNTSNLVVNGIDVTNSLAASGYVTNVTPGTATASKALILNADKTVNGITSLGVSSISINGATIAQEAAFLSGVEAGSATAAKVLVLNSSKNISGINSLNTTTLNLGGTSVTSIHADYLTSITNGTAQANKAIILDANKSITGIGALGTSGVAVTNIASSGFAEAVFISDTYSLKVGARGTTNSTAPGSAYLNYNNADRVLINATGEVSVGTSLFGYRLNIAGSLNANSYNLNGVAADLSFLTGVTAGTAASNKTLVVDNSRNLTNVNSLTVASLTIGSNALTTTEAGYLTSITAGSAAASKALVLDAGKNISGITSLSATTINGSIATASQASITAVGTLSSLSTSGAITTTINNNTTTNSSYQTWTNSLTTAMTVGLSMNNVSPAFGTSSNHKLRFRTNATDAMFIQSSGNISIGSDVDTYKLSVAGSLNATGYYLNGTLLDLNSLQYMSGSTPGTATASKALVTDANVSISGMGALKFTNSGRPFVEGSELGGGSFVGNWGASNRWGIGQHTTGTMQALRIGGCNTDGSWNSIYPIVYSGSFSAMSDYRLKKNFRNIPFGLETINRLQPLMYDLKFNDLPDQLGFIAHEVQEIIPSVVTGVKDAVDANGNEQHQSISYIGLIPITVKAIQELSTKNAELEARIESVIRENEEMKKIIIALYANHNPSDMS